MSSITKAVSRFSIVKYINILNKNATSIRIKERLQFHTSSFLNVMGLEIRMPSLSPTMSEGKIVKWLKKEGDTINPGDVLCDIETDKAIMSMETEEEGILAKILVVENSKTVSVGALIALMVQPGENWQEVEMKAKACEASSPPLEGSKTNKSGPAGLPVKMPSLSPTMTMGTILKWHKREGDTIEAGDVLCDIQTDKAVISFETDEEGILAKILVQEDTKDVSVGTLIALIVGEDDDWTKVVVPQGDENTATQVQTQMPSDSPVSASEHPGKIFGPAARALLSVYQLSPNSIKATGRNNVLLKEDVLKYIQENKLQKKPIKPDLLPPVPAQATHMVSKPVETPKPSKLVASKEAVSSVCSQSFGRRTKEKYVDIELSNLRRVIAKRLTESKQSIPHAYGRVTCQVDDLLNIRKEMSSMGMTASLNDYIIKATAIALEFCPRVNVTCVNDEFKVSQMIDIAIAVATPGGLITPIITDVGKKSVMEISETIKEIVPRARSGRLKPHEFQGGTFTISNLGMFGIKHFTAIINPPHCAILAVGASIDRFGVDMKTHYDMSFTLSYDRRALQEDEVAEFLEKLKFIIENPRQIVAGNISVRRALGL